jgi:hypothetical protein
MGRIPLEALAGWLDRPEVVAHDPARVQALRRALGGPDPPVRLARHGGLVCHDAAPGERRLIEFDRHGTVLTALRWTADGPLAWAKCRIPDGRWVGVEPGAGARHPWGPSDQVWLLDDGTAWDPREAVTVFQAVDWERPDFVPPLAAPRRLPPGAGTAILNLLAGLMKDHGAPRVRYRGPYPTEQLFATLLECFRYDPLVPAPLEQFLEDGSLDWLPAPHERHRVAEDIWVHLRQEVDKVVIQGVAFYRPDWQGVLRREPRVVRPSGDRRICSLWGLGQPLEDRLVIDGSGAVLERPIPTPDPRPPSPLEPVWTPALGALIARESAPPLGDAIVEVLGGLALEWGAVPGDLVQLGPGRARISRQLKDRATAWIGEASEAERAQRAALLALEVARLLAPAIRLEAQERLEALPESEQARIWAAEGSAAPSALGDSVGRLLALILGTAPHS